MIRPPRFWTAALVASGVVLALSAPARVQGSARQHHKLDSVVREAARTGQTARIIVTFQDPAARARGASLIAGRGGHARRALNDVGALSATVDAATIDALALDPGVAGISIDAEVRVSLTAGTRASAASGGRAMGPRQVRGGRGLSVAIVDSGVQPHPDLPASRIRAFVDFVNGRAEPYDDYGHGTHVAGIVAGSGQASASLSEPYAGIAPEAGIVALKVLDGRGAGRTSDVIAALEWIAAHHRRYDIRVVNLSLGHPVFEPAATDPLVRAAEALVRRGLVVVASAGNRGINPATGLVGYGGISSPANGPSIVAVGAVDTQGTDARSDDRVTGYSSRGPTRFDLRVKPDLVAVGHDVVSLAAPGSTLFAGHPARHIAVGGEGVASYIRLSGTSMAAPAVAGTAALLLEANTKLSAGGVRALIAFTAERIQDTDFMTQGAGSLNASGAVRLADRVKPQGHAPAVWLRPGDGIPEPYDDLFGERVAWGKHLIWGGRVLLGDFAYLRVRAWDDNIVWGEDNIVWGEDNIVWGEDNIVWGEDNIVWGEDNIVWGEDNIVWGELFELVAWGRCATAACVTLIWSDDNIVWGEDNIVWGEDNIVWGENDLPLAYWAVETVKGFWSDAFDWTRVAGEDNIVWGEDNIVWGEAFPAGER